MKFREIFRVVAKLLDNNGCKISWQSLEDWLTGYQKAHFHFGPSTTVGQTVDLSSLDLGPIFLNIKTPKFVTVKLKMINQNCMFFGDFFVNYKPISF